MRRTDAIKFALENPGKKITHRLFEDYEFLYADEKGFIYDENDYLFENWEDNMHCGMRLRDGGYWETEWREYK